MAVLVIILGIVVALLGFIPVTRARVGDTLGWGVSLLVLGFVMLLLALVIPRLVG